MFISIIIYFFIWCFNMTLIDKLDDYIIHLLYSDGTGSSSRNGCRGYVSRKTKQEGVRPAPTSPQLPAVLLLHPAKRTESRLYSGWQLGLRTRIVLLLFFVDIFKTTLATTHGCFLWTIKNPVEPTLDKLHYFNENKIKIYK